MSGALISAHMSGLAHHLGHHGGEKGLELAPKNIDHREFSQTHAISAEANAPLCRRLPENPLPHGRRAGSGPRCLVWLSGGIQLGGLCCPQTKQDLKYSSRTGREQKEVCVCVFVRKRKTPTLCFPRGINYSRRGGLSRRVPLEQRNSSSGFGEREVGHGAESEAHIPCADSRSHPTCSGCSPPTACARGSTWSSRAGVEGAEGDAEALTRSE